MGNLVISAGVTVSCIRSLAKCIFSDITMASLLSRSLYQMSSNVARCTSSRLVHLSAVRSADQIMPDGTDHATGLEKYELLAKQAGNEDPFFLKAVNRTGGTKAEPTIINAMDNYRMVGGVCQEEDTNIKWMWLCEGTPKRCECGFWFQLKTHPAPDKYALPL